MKLLRLRKKEEREKRLREILKRVRRIDITTRRYVQEIFSGQYHSVFRGRGIEFSEVREYQPGDDVRTIDWNVTARMGRTYVKVFEEERELTVLIAADMSRSAAFGTRNELKREIAVEISALLAFSAIQNNDLVGLLMFTDRVEKFIPPKKGKQHILRIIRELLAYEPSHPNTDIAAALNYLQRILKRSAIVFLISDFLDGDLKKPLALTAKRHDLIPIVVSDPAEWNLEGAGVLVLEDAETGELIAVDTSDKMVVNEFRARAQREFEAQKKLFASVGIDAIYVRTDEDYVKSLQRFFRQRAQRFR
ncbi:DUF58 domain-containing protein [bacterium]|nr:MAG: DUF58 domain-containing protein [bacterium]